MKKLYLVLLGILFTGYHLFAMSDYEVYGNYDLEREVNMSRADVKLYSAMADIYFMVLRKEYETKSDKVSYSIYVQEPGVALMDRIIIKIDDDTPVVIKASNSQSFLKSSKFFALSKDTNDSTSLSSFVDATFPIDVQLLSRFQAANKILVQYAYKDAPREQTTGLESIRRFSMYEKLGQVIIVGNDAYKKIAKYIPQMIAETTIGKPRTQNR